MTASPAARLDNERLLLESRARDVWRDVVAGRIDEAERDRRLAEIEAARHALKPKPAKVVTIAVRPPRVRRDRALDRGRQRRLAAAGPMPPRLAARFTTGQLACLNILADEVAANGCCRLTNAEIARRAGTCRRTAVAAIREAELWSMICVKRRKVSPTRNLP